MYETCTCIIIETIEYNVILTVIAGRRERVLIVDCVLRITYDGNIKQK